MNHNFNCFKTKLKRAGNTMKSITTKYYKTAGTAVVATTLCAVCTVSLVGQVQMKNEPSGTMISLAEVKESKKADTAFIFDTPTVTYAQMQDMLYETNQLARLETSEKQIEAILSSASSDEKDYAAVSALTATAVEAKDSTEEAAASETEDTYVEEVVEYEAPKPVVTYADENGTYEYQGEFELTAYCACPICCGSYSNMENPTTASGTRATAGRTIAADTSVFPFGTRLVINGQVYVVEDTGGAICGNRIDVFFNSHQDALNFGRQYASVFKQVDDTKASDAASKTDKKSKKKNK